MHEWLIQKQTRMSKNGPLQAETSTVIAMKSSGPLKVLSRRADSVRSAPRVHLSQPVDGGNPTSLKLEPPEGSSLGDTMLL